MSIRISITDPPPITGLYFRKFRGADDYPLMVYVLQACKDIDGIERVDDVEEVANAYANLINCDPKKDMIFAVIEGQANEGVVGYGRTVWWQETQEPSVRLYFGMGWVIPSWRQKGIGQTMLGWQEKHLRDNAATHSDAGSRYFQNIASNTEVAKLRLLQLLEYEPVAYIATMVRPTLDCVQERPLPEGVRLWPVREGHLRLIWEAAKAAFRGQFGYAEPTEEEYLQYINFPHHDPTLWRVAWDKDPDQGGQVVGQVRSFINQKENEIYHRKRGYTEFISVHKAWRNKGLAKALLTRSLLALKERGMEEASLRVHTENPGGAFKLYRGLGYHTVRTEMIYRKPMD
jgi:ribosomal protein S18 acetylase RimI-like enzyme